MASPESMPSSIILQELHNFRELGSVLYIAAHPDDENSRLIAYLARGRGCRTAYLSLTRGDGGQNILGPELGEALGVIRTQELLAARRNDGGLQFFSRALDFGFSKNPNETLSIWNREQVLADVVRVIRIFRPDVLVTRFPIERIGTHGHHTASAQLALEAFKLAGDPLALREQFGDLPPWQPKRILWNGWPSDARRSGGIPDEQGTLKLDIGGYNPLLGESYPEIAARSINAHKSQGLGWYLTRGPVVERFKVLAGEPATGDILDGVETTWKRFEGGAEIDRLAAEAEARFQPQDPAGSLPALLALRSRLATLPSEVLVTDKGRQLDRIIQACLGLYWETTVPQAEVVSGEVLKLHHVAIVRNNYPVRWRAVRYPTFGQEQTVAIDLQANQPANLETSRTLPAGTPLSQPYWLRAAGTKGMFRVDDPALIGRPENPPVFPVEQVFEIDGQTLVLSDEPVQVTNEPAIGETRRRLDVIAPVEIGLGQELELFAPGGTRPLTVKITASRPGEKGTVRLEAPADWQVAPSSQSFSFATAGESAQFTFTVTAPARSTTAEIVASAEIDGARYRNRRVPIRYSHLPPMLLQPLARIKAVSLELAIRGSVIGYLPGSGDSVAECLSRMGFTVKTLTGEDLTAGRLKGFDAVVVGIRAFNTRKDLSSRLPALFAYAEQGGNVIVQYNTLSNLQTEQLAPYALKLSQDRVTDEDAPMTILAPDHPALTTPNRITTADFDGWVQERGLYFPSEWDARFTPLLACNDPGESPKSGGLLVARYGKGNFIYSSLSWFRQLPAGVPGAYRLFANLVSLGK
ncbi:MAG: PIG-L family deacetylase [Opitutaceae bacterium]